MSDGSMTAPYANCKYHDPILIFGYNLYLYNQCVLKSFTCSFTLHRWSLTHAHTLSPEVSFSHTCSRYNPTSSRNHLQLFSLTFITSTLPLANIHTHNPHRPFLYTWTCLCVSCTHIIFTHVSHALSHTSLPNRRV